MGVVRVAVEVAWLGDEPGFTYAGNLLVDTGAEISWVHRAVLAAAGVAVRKRGRAFVLADGTTVRRDVGYALLRSGPFETVDEVVFAGPRDLQLLGARTLEGFNAVVDPVRGRLVAAGPVPAAAA